MSKISLTPNASGTGTLSIASPSTNSDFTLTLPAETGTVLTSGGAIDVNASAPADSLAISSAGNVGIGTTSPLAKFEVHGQSRFASSASSAVLLIDSDATSTNGVNLQSSYYGGAGYGPMKFSTGGSERMRIDSSGYIRVGDLNQQLGSGSNILACSGNGYSSLRVRRGADNGDCVGFFGPSSSSSQVGSISVTTSTTSYNTSSDYRLKENVAPMTGALATVAQLKPVTYTWKADGSAGQGFIAHELQAVVPDAVTGEKDAVETYTDEDGVEQTRPVYQGVDTSFLVATLTAAIQELSAKNDALEARIAALEAA